MRKTVTRTLLTVGLSLGLMNSVFSATDAGQEVDQFILTLHDQKEILRQRMAPFEGINEAVLVIGPTGAGKSTLITWLGDGALRVTRRGENGRGRLILTRVSPEDDIHIEHENVSGTTIPTPLSVRDPSFSHSPIVFLDCPGFEDVGGAWADIRNMASLVEVLKKFENVKILLALNESKITGRSNNQSLFSLLNQLPNMFCNEEELRQMGALVITKKSSDEDPLSDLASFAENRENNLSNEARQFLRHLTSETQPRTWEMEKPNAEGAYHMSLETLWQVIRQSHFVHKPHFRTALSDGSLRSLEILSNRFNETIVEELRANDGPILHAIAGEILAFNGDSDTLRQRVKNLLDFINIGGIDTQQGEDIYLILRDILGSIHNPGLTDPLLSSVRSKIEQIDTLRILLGDITRVGETEISVSFEPNRWLDALSRTRVQLQALWNSVQRSIAPATKTPVADSFMGPAVGGVVRGIAREEERFSLPPEDPWLVQGVPQEKITFRDFVAERSLNYTNDDATLHSTPREVYRIQHEGEADEFLDGNELPAVLYQRVAVDRAAVPNTVNLAAGNVTLSIHRFYQRADGSPYNPIEILAAHPINRGAVRYDHDDRVLSSRRFVTCSATHEDVAVDLGEYPEEARVPYILGNVERAIVPGTLNVGASIVDLRIRRPYNRPDASVFSREEILANYQIAKVFQRYDHNDAVLRSTEFVRCSTNHEGVILQLGDHTDRSFPYTPGDIRGRAMVPCTLNLGTNTVSLNINRAYNRVDRTEYIRLEKFDNQPIQIGATRYTSEDANLRSVKYVMYKATYGGGDVNLEERQDGYEAYRLGNILRRYVAAGTLNLARNIVELNIRRAYHRPDATVYEKDERVDSVIVRGQEKLVEDDANLRFRKYIPCSTIYGDVAVDLGEHEIEPAPYDANKKKTIAINANPTLKALYENTIESLTIAHSYMDSIEIFLEEAIKVNTSLRNISLHHVAISNSGAGASLMRALTINRSIESLQFDHSKIVSFAGGVLFREALKINTTLQFIAFSHQPMDCYTGSGNDFVWSALNEGLKINRGLQSLNLTHRYLSDADANQLLEALKMNTTCKLIPHFTNRRFGCQHGAEN
jgi:energy-coupling factor transporter ATP-binding protein EcfA2